jgi:hypothetical protein
MVGEAEMTQERFDLIAPTLAKYKRRFTVLDLGAGIEPYLSCKISQEFDAVVVMVEKDNIIYPLESFGPHTIWLNTNLDADTLWNLKLCEHFDVVLAMNFLHHFSEDDVARAAVAVRNMGTDVFAQFPYIGDSASIPGHGSVWNTLHDIFNCTDSIGATSQFPMHRTRPIFYLHNSVSALTRTHIEAPGYSADTLFKASYITNQAYTKKGIKDWIPAINLWNFCKLGGRLPQLHKLLQMLNEFPLPTAHHGDITPWNFLIDGQQLHLIDGYEGWEFGDIEGKQETIRKVTECLHL